jgi:hypothetical protein
MCSLAVGIRGRHRPDALCLTIECVLLLQIECVLLLQVSEDAIAQMPYVVEQILVGAM